MECLCHTLASEQTEDGNNVKATTYRQQGSLTQVCKKFPRELIFEINKNAKGVESNLCLMSKAGRICRLQTICWVSEKSAEETHGGGQQHFSIVGQSIHKPNEHEEASGEAK